MKSLITFLVLVFCSAARADDPAISIEVRKGTTENEGYSLAIKNNGSDSTGYYGYAGEGSMQPIFSVIVFRDGKWQRNNGLWCGTGTGICMLDPKEFFETSLSYELTRIAEGTPFLVSVEVPRIDKKRANSFSLVTMLSPVYAKNGAVVEQVADDQLPVRFEPKAK